MIPDSCLPRAFLGMGTVQAKDPRWGYTWLVRTIARPQRAGEVGDERVRVKSVREGKAFKCSSRGFERTLRSVEAKDLIDR